MGRPRESVVLKLLNGSAQRNPGRLRDDSKVAPKDRTPALPDGLLEAVPHAVRDRYRWLVKEFVLPVAHGRPDGIAILTLTQTMIDRDVAAAKVAEFGQVMKHPRTNKPMVQPYFTTLMMLNESVRRQMNELGFTPASRLRHAPPGAPGAPDPSGWDEID